MGTVNSFEGRHADYAFFMAHTDEPTQCRRVLLEAIKGLKPGAVRWLDFGCGSGEFLEGVLKAWDRPAAGVSLHLVDVDAGALKKAERRLGSLARVTGSTARVPEGETFDVVASNHALYYAEDLGTTLTALAGALAGGGLGIWTLGGRENQLCRLWLDLFARTERPLPFFLAEDVAEWLESKGLPYRRKEVVSILRFPDAGENRDRIARFLFGPRLEWFGVEMVREALGAWSRGGEMVMENRDVCFVVEG